MENPRRQQDSGVGSPGIGYVQASGEAYARMKGFLFSGREEKGRASKSERGQGKGANFY